MRENDFHQPFRQATAAMLRQHKHVCDPREGGVVGYDTRESDLIVSLVGAKRKRILDRTFDYFARTAARPIGIVREVVVNKLDVEPRAIGADQIIVALPD